MTEPQHSQPPDDLERALLDLGAQLDWPDEPNLLHGVRQRLQAQAERRSLLAQMRAAATLPRFAWASVALVAILAIIMTVSDSTRTTVADRLGLPGVSISTDRSQTVSPGNALQIGEQTTLEEATSRTGGQLVPPPDDVLGPPEEVFVLDQDGTVQVTYIYLPRSDLPEVGHTGVGLLISQFNGNTNISFVQKQLGPENTIELVEIHGQSAYWITGDPHVFYYERPDGEIYEESIRLAANVLLWEQNGKTLRIETSLALDDALQIAEAMRATR